MRKSYYRWQNQEVSIYHFQELSSTNDVAWQLFREGRMPPLVVTAKKQTAGRGQWGRQWVSGDGGLYLSLLITPEMSIEEPSHLTISSAFGVATLLSCYQLPVKIKWLNDLFLERKKLGGILTETSIQNQTLKAVVIGMGINWSNLVPERGIALKDYLSPRQSKVHLSLSPELTAKINVSDLPSTIESLSDLKTIAIAGLLFGYKCYSEEGLINLLPQYEALLLEEI